MSVPRQPLQGVRVLDLSNLLGSPQISMFLADFGAEVIKTEHPEKGDEMRRWGLSKNGVGLFWKVINRNKKLITLNLSKPRGQELVKRFAKKCDVLLHSYRPGTMEKWGLGYEDLAAVNPKLIVVGTSGYGSEGPYAQRPGFGSIAETFAGLTYMNGHPDREPLMAPFAMGDASAAIFGAYGVMLALYNRDVGGGTGQFIDHALYDGLLTMAGPSMINYDQLEVVHERMGNRQPLVSPRNTFQTADGHWIAISGSTQVTFERAAGALGIPGIIADPRFLTNVLRTEHNEALATVIQDAVAKLTRAEALARLEAAGAPVGPVNSIADIMVDPQIRARGNIVTVPDEELGPIRMQAPVPKLKSTPGQIRHAGLTRGAHNREVYQEFLGLTDEQLAELRAEGVI